MPMARVGRRAVAILLLAGSLVGAQALPTETDRLVATGKLWIIVKYFHPALAYRADLDWDQALVEALPKIRAAQTVGEYEGAVRGMLRVLPQNATPTVTGAGQRFWVHRGFVPEHGDAAESPFYSAFLYKRGDAVEEVDVPMGGFSVRVALSESAGAGPASPPVLPAARTDAAAYPSTERRILAAYKIWGVLHYFFAYRDLMDEDWDGLLVQFLPRMIAAKDALEYNLTIAEWLTHAADTFTTPDSAVLTQYFGEAPVGLRVRVVEKHVTVTEVLDDEAAKAGVKIGDVIKKVDGETLVDRFKREVQYVTASTPQRLSADVVERLLNGADGSTALLTMEDFAGNRKEVTLKRSQQFTPLLKALPAGETVRLLRGGIGYVDLRRIKRDEVDGVFEKFKNAPAILFDMRGVPADGAATQMIGARLAADSEAASAIVTGPIVSFPDVPHEGVSGRSSSYFFLETLANSGLVKYKGRTVMLVDECTINDGEGAGLIVEAANKTEFVGSPTAGAHSVLTNFTVPGDVTISFSGEDIRHGNGGKLQRLGLQPNTTAVPTLTGIRTGKDEVLEKALDLVLPKPPSAKTLPARASAP
jgi:C-terminal processing protease CtpA/Prc